MKKVPRGIEEIEEARGVITDRMLSVCEAALTSGFVLTEKYCRNLSGE
jgi:hypothetical protein